jgi:hypothetical protein
MMAGASKGKEIFEARIILTPCIRTPFNAGSLMGLLHGDPKNPIGVQLFPRTSPEPNISHGISSSIFGSTGMKKVTAVDGMIRGDVKNITQEINKQDVPQGQSIVIKVPTTVPRSYIGSNKLTSETPGYLIDDPGSYVLVGEDEVRMIADHGNGMVINAQSGITINGKVNIGSSIQDVRLGGAWRINPMQQFCIPSTAVTPIPTLIWAPPGTGLLQNITKYLNLIKSA